jgi:hypothetical protein
MAMSAISAVSGGPRVQRFRRAVNGHLGRRKFAWRKVPLRGRPDNRLFEATHLVAWQLGFSTQQLKKIMRGEVTRHAEQIILGQKARSAAMKKRDLGRRKQAAALRRRHREKKGTLASVRIKSTQPGGPHYGGAVYVMGQVVSPLLYGKYGYPIGSGKRTPRRNLEVGGSPNSDHLTTKTLTFARDYPTFNGEEAARELALIFGWEDWKPNSYATHTFRIGKYSFRLQILWGGLIKHGDHIHVGIQFLGE